MASALRRGKDGVRPDAVTGFYVLANGQIESGEFQGVDNLFCRYAFTYGPDWKIVQGIDNGFSQVVAKGSSTDASVVWNFPLEVTFKSTNAHGWPRLVVSVYSQDFLGRYVIRGYGSALIPTVPGRHVRFVRMFTPVASTLLQSFLGWLTGNRPQFYDLAFVAGSEGREVTRVESTGTVRVALQVLTRGMAAHGFSTGGPPDLADAETEAILGFVSPTSAPTGSASLQAASPLTAPSGSGLLSGGSIRPRDGGRLGTARPVGASTTTSAPGASASTASDLIAATRRLVGGGGSLLPPIAGATAAPSSSMAAAATAGSAAAPVAGDSISSSSSSRMVREVEGVAAGGGGAAASATTASAQHQQPQRGRGSRANSGAETAAAESKAVEGDGGGPGRGRQQRNQSDEARLPVRPARQPAASAFPVAAAGAGPMRIADEEASASKEPAAGAHTGSGGAEDEAAGLVPLPIRAGARRPGAASARRLGFGVDYSGSDGETLARRGVSGSPEGKRE